MMDFDDNVKIMLASMLVGTQVLTVAVEGLLIHIFRNVKTDV